MKTFLQHLIEAPMTTSGAGSSKTSKGKGGKTEYKDDDQREPEPGLYVNPDSVDPGHPDNLPGLYVNPDSVDPGHPDNLHDYKPFGEKPRWPIPSWDNPSNIDDRFPQYPAPYNHPIFAPKPYTPYLVPEPDGGVRQPYLPRPVKDRRPTFLTPHDKYTPTEGPY